MANRVLGIEIGENLTRVVEIDTKQKIPRFTICSAFRHQWG